MRIAIDAMGGDHAPTEIVLGAVQALQANPPIDDLELVLVGIEDDIKRELERNAYASNSLSIEPASQVIAMDESPVAAVKKKKDSSIARMVGMAAAKEVDACISAGNTGAFAAACQLKLKSLAGVKRPGIAVVIPSFHGPIVLCDVGANIAAKPHHLYDYGLMASCYAHQVLKIESPRVGVLSIGEEAAKGTNLVKKTSDLLSRDAGINFVGNVEGRDFFSGQADVIVSDGFVGNVVLKVTEGMAEGLFKIIGTEIATEKPEWSQHFKSIMQNVWAKHDYSEYGGAPLLGVGGVCIICHGSSGARAIRNAVRVASEYHTVKLNEQIVESIGHAKERR
jgi:glycerol-3-phosphate acyltransferase PlsX